MKTSRTYRAIMLRYKYIFCTVILCLLNDFLVKNRLVGSDFADDMGTADECKSLEITSTEEENSDGEFAMLKSQKRADEKTFFGEKYESLLRRRRSLLNFSVESTKRSDATKTRSIYENNVYKVKNRDYYMWVASNNECEILKENDQSVVNDPLEGLSNEEIQKRLRPVCPIDKYNEPFQYPNAIRYLRAVYYDFLSRSKNRKNVQREPLSSERVQVIRRYLKQLKPPEESVSKEDIAYSSKMHNLHPFVGMLERTPLIEFESLFPKYLPIGLPEKYIEFYNKRVSLTREDCMTVYKYETDSSIKYKIINPKKIRVTGESCYELATYCDNVKANWTVKLNRLFKSSLVPPPTCPFYSEKTSLKAMVAFYKKTGCSPYLTGMIVNPNAPYLGFSPDAVTYCRGEHYLLHITTPYSSKNHSLESAMKELLYLNCTNGTYSLKKHHMLYGKVQLGLGILHLEKCLFGIYGKSDQKIKLSIVRFDRAFFAKMITNVYRVYFSKLIPRFYHKYHNCFLSKT